MCDGGRPIRNKRSLTRNNVLQTTLIYGERQPVFTSAAGISTLLCVVTNRQRFHAEVGVRSMPCRVRRGEPIVTAFLWFLLGLWVGGSLGFLVFACLQVSRDGERSADAGAIRGMERRISPRTGVCKRILRA